MNFTLKKIVVLYALAACTFYPAAIFAQSADYQDYGLENTAKEAQLKRSETIPQLTGTVVGTALSMIALIFFILMVYAGFLWMTAHGNEQQVKKAQDTLTGAIIGIIVVLGSYAITKFIIDSTNGSEPVAGAVQNQGALPGRANILCNQIAAEPDCNAQAANCAWAGGACRNKACIINEFAFNPDCF